MNKEGQFFLIAALLISGIAIGFSTLYNSAYIERADTQVFDLSEELYTELQQTYDAGLVRGKEPAEIQGNLKKLADYYQLQNPDSTFSIYYGDGTEQPSLLTTSSDTTSSELVNEDAAPAQGGSIPNPSSDASSRSVKSTDVTTTPAQQGKPKKVKIRIKYTSQGTSRSQGNAQVSGGVKPAAASNERVIESPAFEVKEGQNFYFVIRKKVKNEQVVAYR